jgi:cell division septation protein DedD
VALGEEDELWVQVLASSRRAAIESARSTLVEAGFPRTNQKVVETIVAGGTTLLKLRVGPFPDRASADRVMARMRSAGFPDAWVVTP